MALKLHVHSPACNTELCRAVVRSAKACSPRAPVEPQTLATSKAIGKHRRCQQLFIDLTPQKEQPNVQKMRCVVVENRKRQAAPETRTLNARVGTLSATGRRVPASAVKAAYKVPHFTVLSAWQIPAKGEETWFGFKTCSFSVPVPPDNHCWRNIRTESALA